MEYEITIVLCNKKPLHSRSGFSVNQNKILPLHR